MDILDKLFVQHIYDPYAEKMSIDMFAFVSYDK